MNKTAYKLLLIAPEGMGNGGVQAVMMDIVRNLKDEYQFDVLVFTSERRHHEPEFLSYGGDVFRIPNYEGKNRFRQRLDYYIRGWRIYRGVKKILKEHGPYQAIHCNNYYEAGPCLKAAKEAGIPVRIAHSHAIQTKTHFFREQIDQYYLRLIKRHATHMLGCSQEACDTFFGNDKGEIVNNPYCEDRFNPTHYAVTRSTAPVLIQIGRFNVGKNQLFSLSVLDQIRSVYPQAQLHLIGFDHGDYLQEITKQIETLGLKQNVQIHPSDANTPLLLSQSSAMLLPSLYEGFGIVLIEAQAMGVACYASDTVPMATNCGGCTYLSLELGAAYWAEKILQDFEANHGKHMEYDCSAFRAKNVAQVYLHIYGGVKS